jgi:flagellin-like protein
MMNPRRSTRGLSPIFATLILIAIAVIAGIVVYMFASGTIASMTGGGTAGQEKVAVQGVDLTSGSEVALAQNTGSTEVIIVNAIVKDASGTIVTQDATGGTLTVGGDLVPIPIDVTGLTAGNSYTVTLVSSKGGSFVSSSFIP